MLASEPVGGRPRCLIYIYFLYKINLPVANDIFAFRSLIKYFKETMPMRAWLCAMSDTRIWIVCSERWKPYDGLNCPDGSAMYFLDSTLHLPRAIGQPLISIPDYPWLSLIIPDYPWLSLIIPDYPWLSLIAFYADYPWLSLIRNY